jgi:hypothetical protein
MLYQRTKHFNMRFNGPKESEKLNNFVTDVSDDLNKLSKFIANLNEQIQKTSRYLTNGGLFNEKHTIPF